MINRLMGKAYDSSQIRNGLEQTQQDLEGTPLYLDPIIYIMLMRISYLIITKEKRRS